MSARAATFSVLCSITRVGRLGNYRLRRILFYGCQTSPLIGILILRGLLAVAPRRRFRTKMFAHLTNEDHGTTKVFKDAAQPFSCVPRGLGYRCALRQSFQHKISATSSSPGLRLGHYVMSAIILTILVGKSPEVIFVKDHPRWFI